MNDLEAQKIKSALKTQLRLKGIGYQEVSEHLACSVPTVKRILGPEELTLNRLLQLLQLVELSLSELEMLTGKGEGQKYKFTAQQEAFLVKNRHCLSYLMKIYSGLSPKQIAEKYALTTRSTERYLIALEKQNLIRVTGRQKIKPTYKEVPLLGKGPLGTAYYESLIRMGADFFVRWISTNIYSQTSTVPAMPSFFTISGMSMAPESYKRFALDQEKLLREYSSVSSYEEKTLPKESLQTAVVMAAHSLVPSDYKHLAQLDEVFGPLIQL